MIKPMRIKNLMIAAMLVFLIFIFIIMLARMIINDKANEIKINEKTNNLPDIYEINPEETPILYDFVNSSASYMSNMDVSEYGSFYIIATNKKEAFVSSYSHGERVIFPTIGTKPKRVNETSVDNINTSSGLLSSDRIVSEGDWLFFIISDFDDGLNENNSLDSNGFWGGIELRKFMNEPLGLMNDVVNGESGWPTKWLMKEPYKSILKIEGYNLDEPFWAKYNINSVRVYKKNDKVYTVKVVQLDRFKVEGGKIPLSLNEEQLERFLEHNSLE